LRFATLTSGLRPFAIPQKGITITPLSNSHTPLECLLWPFCPFPSPIFSHPLPSSPQPPVATHAPPPLSNPYAPPSTLRHILAPPSRGGCKARQHPSSQLRPFFPRGGSTVGRMRRSWRCEKEEENGWQHIHAPTEPAPRAARPWPGGACSDSGASIDSWRRRELRGCPGDNARGRAPWRGSELCSRPGV
jgi:hypothetical protein